MVSLSHILRMTGPIGMFEHCMGSVPDPLEGLTTDDNARALQLMLRLQTSSDDAKKLIPIYFHFLVDAAKGTGFHNERLVYGTWEDSGGIGDWFGRAMVALAEATVTGPERLRSSARKLFDEKIPFIPSIGSIHTIPLLLEAYCLRFSTRRKDSMIKELAGKLLSAYHVHSDANWQWFEDKLTYENARVPESLFYAYEVTGQNDYLKTGLSGLDFLLSETFDTKKNVFSFVGNKGWFHKGGTKAVFGQQPVDAAATVEACCKAYSVTKDKKYREYARKAFDWYTGENILGLSLKDTKSGGICNGLEDWGVNTNQGAESILTYGLACCALQDMETRFPS